MKKKIFLSLIIFLVVFMFLQKKSSAYVGNGYVWNKTEISININDNFEDYLDEFEVKFYYKGQLTDEEVKVSLDKFYYGGLSVSTSEVGRKTVKLIAEVSGYSTIDRRDILLNILDSEPPVITQLKDLNFEVGEPFNYNEYFMITDNYGIQSVQYLDHNVNQTVPGSYNLEVLVTDNGGNTVSKNYMVVVRSTSTPVLSLANFVYVEYGDLDFDITKYVSASDSIEGDLTSSVKITGLDIYKLGDQTVTISVANSNGYVSKKEKTITVIDTEAPTLELKTYSDVIYLEDEKKFDLKSYITKCNDNCDNLSEDDVIIDSSDFSYTYGSHVIVYKLCDSSKNYTTRKLNLNVSYKSTPTIIANDIEIKINSSLNILDNVIVSDPYDEAIGDSLIIDTGLLDLTKAGKYEITLEATNKAGNTTYKKIYITVYDDSTPSQNTLSELWNLIYENKIIVIIILIASSVGIIYLIKKKSKNKGGV